MKTDLLELSETGQTTAEFAGIEAAAAAALQME